MPLQVIVPTPGFLGIIGGLGPETSSKFHLDLIRRSRKEFRAQPRLIMSIAPVTEKVEARAIKGNIKPIQPFLEECIAHLNNAGVSAIVIPCNTVYALLHELQKQSSVPIISILDETIKELKKRKLTKIGLLATKTSIQSNLFQPKLEKAGIEFLCPSKAEQKQVTKAIGTVLKTGRASPKSKKVVEQIVARMKADGVEAVVLSCTDLQFLAPKKADIPIIDSLEVLTNASFEVLKKHLSKSAEV